MSWFLIAMAAPLIWSFVNHIDKYLLTKYVKSGSVGSLLVFSSLIGLPIMLIAYVVEPQVFDLPLRGIMTLVGAGILGAIFVLFYLYAMNEDEASVVMPFFQTIPIFGMIIGFLVLGEKLTGMQITASLVVFAGAGILSIDTEKGLLFKKRLVAFVLISSFLFALQQVLFKVGAGGLEENFWASIFWEHLGLFLAGIFMVVFIKPYRMEFMALIRDNSAAIFGLNISSEFLTIIGNSLVAYATLLAPVALVMTVELYQPAFVFIIGALLTIFAPQIAKEKIKGRHLAAKLVSITIIFAGSYLLYSVSP